MRIRPATPEDVPDIGRVHALSRNAAYVGLVPDEALARVTPRTQAEVWRHRTVDDGRAQVLLVAEVDDAIVGFSSATGPDGDGDAELSAIHVLPGQHGAGVGQALHDAVLETVRSWGCPRIGLWVLRGNERAQSFYRRNGWVHDGTAASHDVGGVDVPILRYERPVTF